MNKICVIVGLNDDTANNNGVYTIVNEDHGAFTSLGDARDELLNILEEVKEDSKEMEYEFSYELDDKRLEVTFETGSVETYTIHQLTVN